MTAPRRRRKAPKAAAAPAGRTAAGPPRRIARPTVAQLFERRDPRVRAIYERILKAASSLGPVRENPNLSSIHLVRETTFAGVTPRKDGLVLTLKSATDVNSPRVHRSQRASAGRWHVEFRLAQPADMDRELKGWLAKAYELSG